MEFRLVMYRGKYAAEWREGGQQHRRSLRTADRGVALQRLEAFSAEANKPQDDRIKTLMEAYLKDKPSDTAKFSAQALLPFWGSYTAGQISTDLCRRYTESRRKLGRGDGTILREMGVLKAAVRRYASKAGAVFEMPSSPPPKDRYLTKAEFRKLVDAASDTPHLRLFLLVAVATRLASGEPMPSLRDAWSLDARPEIAGGSIECYLDRRPWTDEGLLIEATVDPRLVSFELDAARRALFQQQMQAQHRGAGQVDHRAQQQGRDARRQALHQHAADGKGQHAAQY